MKKSILIIAGEVSGDLHAAGVVRAFKARSPETSFWGIGGDHLHAEGVELLEHTESMSVMGFSEALRHYRFFKCVMRRILAETCQRKPDAALLVDYPGFNLRLAAALKKHGVQVYYYISPKVWAWNSRRIRKMIQVIDRLLVIFPFELDVFKGSGLWVDFVGNPLVEQIREFLASDRKPLPWQSERRIALLPGSRSQEIRRILPTLLKAAKRLGKRFPDASFIIASPNEHTGELTRKIIDHTMRKPRHLTLLCGESLEVLRQADAAVVVSGTATLESALIGTPHILVYKTSHFTYWFSRAVIKIRHIGLVNILARRTLCPEILQYRATPTRVEKETARLMELLPEREAMLEGFAEIRRILGTKHAAENTAAILAE